MADRASLQTEKGILTQAIAGVTRAIELREQNGDSTADLRTTLANYQAQLQAINQQLAAFDSQPPAASAGEITAQGQRARDQGAQTVTPPAAPADQGTGATNADRFPSPAPGDAGTDDPVRLGRTSQSLPPITAAPGPVPATTSDLDPFDITGAVQSDDQSVPTSQPGEVAPNDNAASQSGTTVAARINSLFGGDAGRIVPQGNALDAYASYTYSISIYLLSDADFRLMIQQKILPKGWQLILQSAGAPVAGGKLNTPDAIAQQQEALTGVASSTTQPTLGRNEFFDLDLYIDDVIINHLAPTRGTRQPLAATELAFKIYEPNGLSFLPNLYAAVQQYVRERGGISINQPYSAQNFLMAIRFYGYDDKGNLVTASNKRDQISGTTGQIIQQGSDATIEKYIPFQFTQINWRIQNKITEYDCKAAVIQDVVLTGQARGTIPYNIELSGQSVGDILTGPISFTTASGQSADTGDDADRQGNRAPPGAGGNPNTGPYRPGWQINPRAPSVPSDRTRPPGSSAPGINIQSPDADNQPGGFYGNPLPAPPKADAASKARLLTINAGLQEALNRYQAELVKAEYQEYPDIYEIVIVEDVIANATVKPPGDFNPRQSAMIRAKTAKDAKDGIAQSVDVNSRTIKAAAGESIVSFIDRVMRQSSYVLEQQQFYIDSQTNETEDQTANKVLAWYRIGLEAEPTGNFDRLRMDKQYKLRYTIAAYRVAQIKSDYFPRTEFPGVHKVYNYWFTGENTQILNFEQSFNNLWYITQNAPSLPKVTSNYLEADRFYYAPLQPENSQGQENMRTYDGAASAASWLYSPGDQAQVKLDIVGDPAWIWQGELWSGFPKDLYVNYAPFLTDGTVNPYAGDLMFEIAFNQPVDYDLRTGLLDAGQSNYGTNTAARSAGLNNTTTPAGKARERYLYRARTCRSQFRQGRFLQELWGDIVVFPLSDPGSTVERTTPGGAQGVTQSRAPDLQGNTPAVSVLRANPPLPSDGLQMSGVFPSPAVGFPSLIPQAAAQPPTSSSQAVGQPASGFPSIATLGGATGPAAGAPAVTVVLSNGQQVDITTQDEIRQLLASGQITPFSADVASRRLSQAQEAANNPITSAAGQLMTKEA